MATPIYIRRPVQKLQVGPVSGASIRGAPAWLVQIVLQGGAQCVEVGHVRAGRQLDQERADPFLIARAHRLDQGTHHAEGRAAPRRWAAMVFCGHPYRPPCTCSHLPLSRGRRGDGSMKDPTQTRRKAIAAAVDMMVSVWVWCCS